MKVEILGGTIGMETKSTTLKAERVAEDDMDEDILDFLVYKAIKAVLRDFQLSTRNGSPKLVTRTPNADIHLDLVDCEPQTPQLIGLAPTENL